MSADRSPLLASSVDPTSTSRLRISQLPPPQITAQPSAIWTDPVDEQKYLADQLSPTSSYLQLPASSSPPTLSSILLSRYRTRHSAFILSTFLLLLLLLYCLTERTVITSGGPPLLSPSSLSTLNNHTLSFPYFPNHSVASNSTHRTRVVYFIIDGLRYSALNSSTPLSSFLTSLSPDLLVLPLTCQLPTISIPNWLTLLTSTSPSYHGRTGNDDPPTPLLLSSLFSTASTLHSPTGLSTSEWWPNLLSPHLTPFRGTGSYSDALDYGDEVYKRSASYRVRDGVGQQRLREAIEMKNEREGRWSKFDYELFLAYWENVDGQSHAWGGSSPQTADAITAVVDDMRRAMAAVWEADEWSRREGGVQWTTIFAITSDHGHLDVGGHGGDAPVLTTIPLIVYSNHSGLSSFTSQLPAPPASYVPSTKDIATTLAALIGVPVPRQSEGMFIPRLLNAFAPVNIRAWLHYFDLFMQRRALTVEVANTLDVPHILNDDLLFIPPTPDPSNVTSSINDLNDRIGRLITAMDRARDASLSSQLAVNWVLALLLLVVILLPLPCWVYDSKTFLDISALFPQRVSAAAFHVWFLVRSCLVNSYRHMEATPPPLPPPSTPSPLPPSASIDSLLSSASLSPPPGCC